MKCNIEIQNVCRCPMPMYNLCVPMCYSIKFQYDNWYVWELSIIANSHSNANSKTRNIEFSLVFFDFHREMMEKERERQCQFPIFNSESEFLSFRQFAVSIFSVVQRKEVIRYTPREIFCCGIGKLDAFNEYKTPFVHNTHEHILIYRLPKNSGFISQKSNLSPWINECVFGGT